MTINTDKLLLLTFIALVIPLIVQTFKLIKHMLIAKWKMKKIPLLIQPVLISVLWALILCFSARAGIFEAFGFVLLCKWLDYMTTAFIVSLGVDKLYGLIINMKDYQKKIATEEMQNEK